MTLKTTLLRPGADVDPEVEVTYEYIPAHRGHRDRYGCPEEPDEPETVELSSVKDLATGQEVDLTESDETRLIAECWDDLESRASATPPDEDR